MDVGGYGQRLAQLGTAGVSAMGRVEGERKRAKAQQAQMLDAIQGENAGVLTGALTRGALGVYDERKNDFEAKHPGQDYSALDDLQGLFEGWS